MIETKWKQALIFSFFTAMPGLALAQGMMQDTAPSTSNPAGAIPTASENQAQTLTEPQITGILLAANEAEIRQGKVAEKSAKRREVINFAQQMVKDHGQALQEVKTFSSKLSLKAEPSAVRDQLESAARETDMKLKGKKGADFDRTYMEGQANLHQLVLTTLDNHLIPNAKTEDLKTLLGKTRAAVASHLDMAKQLQGSASSTTM